MRWLLVLLPLLVLNGCDEAIYGCNYQADSAELIAEISERGHRLPVNVMNRITALHSRATAHEIRGEHQLACDRINEAFTIVRQY